MARGDVCTNCGHPFVRSFINFDILPLVEFVPEPSISDEEAIELIRQTPPNSLGNLSGQSQAKGGGKKSGVWKESKEGAADTLTFGGAEDEEDAMHEAMGVNLGESDLFTRCLNLTLEKQVCASYFDIG
jgi:intraflagellar transport protein 122